MLSMTISMYIMNNYHLNVQVKSDLNFTSCIFTNQQKIHFVPTEKRIQESNDSFSYPECSIEWKIETFCFCFGPLFMKKTKTRLENKNQTARQPSIEYNNLNTMSYTRMYVALCRIQKVVFFVISLRAISMHIYYFNIQYQKQ